MLFVKHWISHIPRQYAAATRACTAVSFYPGSKLPTGAARPIRHSRGLSVYGRHRRSLTRSHWLDYPGHRYGKQQPAPQVIGTLLLA